MNALVLNGVTKKFLDLYAVRDLSLEIRPGTIFGLLGPNGAGKTTTIRMIVNIFAPDSGEIFVLGERPSSRLKRRIGYLPEERGLYKDMKIGDLLLFFTKLKGVEKNRAKQRVDEWLTLLGLMHWKNKKPAELSKGMAQKVQFLVSVLHEPELLILDEPFSGFDPVSVKQMQGIVIDLKKRGTTIILSTHQMEQVEQLCDEICLINRSKKVLAGTLRDVKNSFGLNTVIIDYQGLDTFLHNGLVRSVNRYATYCEVRLNEGADCQELLMRALASGVRVNRFELVQPSLNDIFISTVENSV